MRTLLTILVSSLVVGAAACEPPDPDAPAADPDAPAGEGVPESEWIENHRFEDEEVTRIHSRMVAQLAPDGGWERARYLEFDWVVHRPDAAPLRRSHRIDRWEATAMVRSPGEAGEMVAVFPVDDPESGTVALDGRSLEGEEAEERLQGAHRAHVNDSYWLLMPYKWTDPGVRAEFLGTETDEDGREWEVVELSFEEDVGLTPRNVYRAFIAPETGLMERWHFLSDRDADPAVSDWARWDRFGPISLATRREQNGELRIGFENIRVMEEPPADAFELPRDG